MTQLPPPADRDVPVAQLIGELDALVGRERFVEICVDLLRGAPRTAYVQELRYLTGHAWEPGSPSLDPEVWKDYWVRTWGARGLLHHWDDRATDAVVAGLADEHYRPAEMCLKVSARHEVAGSGPGAAALARHAMPRVRANAMRTLGVVGDTEHVDVVLAVLDDPEPWVREQAARAYRRLAARLDLPDVE
jgi:HEAT repeat protein